MTTKLFIRWLPFVCLGVGAVLLGNPMVLAQTPYPASQTLEDDNQNINDIFQNRNGASSLLDLINRVQSLSGQSSAEFAAEQGESLDAAAAEFRSKQLQRLNGSQSGSSVKPIIDNSQSTQNSITPLNRGPLPAQ